LGWSCREYAPQHRTLERLEGEVKEGDTWLVGRSDDGPAMAVATAVVGIVRILKLLMSRSGQV